jgi:hypothetical protein
MIRKFLPFVLGIFAWLLAGAQVSDAACTVTSPETKCCIPAHHEPPANQSGCTTPCIVGGQLVCDTSIVRCGKLITAKCATCPTQPCYCTITDAPAGSPDKAKNWQCQKVSCTVGGQAGFQCKFKIQNVECGTPVTGLCHCSGVLCEGADFPEEERAQPIG